MNKVLLLSALSSGIASVLVMCPALLPEANASNSATMTARPGSLILAAIPGRNGIERRVGFIKDIFGNGEANIYFPGDANHPILVKLADSGFDVKCLYNKEVCVDHRVVVHPKNGQASKVGTITGVYSNGFVAVQFDGEYLSGPDPIFSLPEIGVQVDCAVISCEYKLK